MRRRSSTATLFLILGGLVVMAPLPAAASWVSDVLELCPEGKPYVEASTGPELEWDDWLVSGGQTGTSRRFPEETGPYVPARVTVEYLQAGDFQAQSLTGGKPGERWMVWVDTDQGCVVLKGTETSMQGPGASYEAGPKRRVFKRGDLELVLELDERQKAQDESKLSDGAKCKSGSKCKSGNCCGAFCRSKQADGAACEVACECSSNSCVEKVCKAA